MFAWAPLLQCVREQVKRRRPSSRFSFRTVADHLRHAALCSLWIAEGVDSIAVEIHLPVCARVAHFGLECSPMIRRDKRVVGSDAHQDAGLDRAGTDGGRFSGEIGVEADRRYAR